MAKDYLGPAAKPFLSNEFRAVGVNANTVGREHITPLADHIREHAARVMGTEKASELAEALARCASRSASAGRSAAHQLATDAAAKLMAAGRLRKAEMAYLELVEKHGDRESYVSLAHVQAGLEDEAAALNTLREGAARFARAGDRGNAVSLLIAATTLAPMDLSAHRRLAAALANQGDLPGAVDEYARYVDAAIASGDSRRALLELSYGRETLGDVPGLIALVDRISSPEGETRPVDRPRSDASQPPARRPLPVKPVPDAPLQARVRPVVPRVQPASVAAPPKTAPASVAAAPKIVPIPAKPAPLARTWPVASATAMVQRGARTLTHAELEAPVDVLARTGVLRRKTGPRPATDMEQVLRSLTPTGSGLDAAALAASRAALLTSARDVRATDAALDAARRLLALGKLQSASDVLLDFIGHGFTDREAQRLLIEIDCALGRRDVAKEKCNLLGHAYRLDGHTAVAEDVERLARIL